MSRPIFGLLIALVAFSCMLYELVLAQTSAVLLGNALLNYSVTICIYLAALGVGSLYFQRLKHLGRALLWTEIFLSYLGPLAPVLAVVAEYILRGVMDPTGYPFHLANETFIYALVAVIGLLSGLELPILISLGESRFQFGSGTVLGLDYGGTLLAVAVFPTFGMAYMGLFGTAALAGIGSWCGAALTLYAAPREEWGKWQVVAMVPSLVLILFLAIYESEVRAFISSSIYLSGVK